MSLNLDYVVDGEEPVAQAVTPQPEGLPENATMNADGSITLRLTWPAVLRTKDASGVINEEPVGKEMVFHRLRGADLRAMLNAAGPEASMVLFNRSTRAGDARGPRIFDALDAVDVKAALDIVGFLSGAGRKTGR